MANKQLEKLQLQEKKLKEQQAEIRRKIKRAKDKELLKQARQLVLENEKLKKENAELKQQLVMYQRQPMR